MVHREWHDHQGHRLPGDPGATSGGLSHGALVGTVPLGPPAKLGGQTGCTHWSQEGGANAERMPRVIKIALGKSSSIGMLALAYLSSFVKLQT